MPEYDNKSAQSQSSPAATTPRFVLLLPFVLLIVLLVFSPNFHWQQATARNTPYGSDFLQEWIGGTIVLSENRQRLYDLGYVQTLQHNESLIGFRWPAEDYFPMVYPPYYYLLVSPLSHTEYRWAVVIWAVLSTLTFSTTGFLLYRFYPLLRQGFTMWFVAAVLFVPWIKCLSMGQKSGFLLLLFTGTFLLLDRGRPFWAGILFGLVAIKPQLGLVVGATMLFKRQWRFAFGAGLTIGICILVSWWIEPAWWSDYFRVVTGMADYVETGGYQLADSHNLWGGLRFMFPALNPILVKSLAAVFAIGILAIVCRTVQGEFLSAKDHGENNFGVVATKREVEAPSESSIPLSSVSGGASTSQTCGSYFSLDQQPGSPEARFPLEFSLLVLATVLLSPHFYSYDLTIVLLPLMLILSQIGFRRKTKVDGWLVGLVITFYVLAGSFTSIAASVGFQPSLFLLLAMIGLLAGRAGRSVST